jgi:uncharacterized membrane protein YkgB
MAEQNKYSQLSHKELLLKEADLKKRQKFLAVICVVVTLLTLISIYKKTTGLMSSLSILIALFFTLKTGSDLKKVQEEIKTR